MIGLGTDVKPLGSRSARTRRDADDNRTRHLSAPVPRRQSTRCRSLGDSARDGRGYELVDRVSEVALPQRDHAMPTLLCDRTHESLRVRMAVGCPVRRLDDADPDLLEPLLESVAPLTISVAD